MGERGKCLASAALLTLLDAVSPELIAALIDVESRWNAHAVSVRGAMGLMQLMPATAGRFGAVQPFDVDQNIAAGTRYVTTLMWEFHGDLRLVAGAYDAGDTGSY